MRDCLKLRLDLNSLTQNTKTSFVAPVDHTFDVSSFTTLVMINPSLQWNLSRRLTTQIGYAYSLDTLNNRSINSINFSFGILY